MGTQVHPAGVAGFFYPKSAQELEETLEELFNDSQALKIGAVKALIVPHAGYIYSGKTAARAYESLRDQQFDRVIILGPTHRVYFPGIALHDASAFQTPLGELELDQESLKELAAEVPNAAYAPGVFQDEHCLEVQLPFLQKILKGSFQILPILIGDTNPKTLNELSNWLRKFGQNQSTLVIASTDFSHFFPKGTAKKLDFTGQESILALDAQNLWEAQKREETALCGVSAVYTTIKCFEDGKIHFVDYSHSGMVTGDNSSVVGYMSFVLQEG